MFCGLIYQALYFKFFVMRLAAVISNHICIHHVLQISGQEDLSYKTHCHRLFAPLWPNCLGITDSCQYITVNDTSENQSQKSGQYLKSHCDL